MRLARAGQKEWDGDGINFTLLLLSQWAMHTTGGLEDKM
jgi:hypothetical protein